VIQKNENSILVCVQSTNMSNEKIIIKRMFKAKCGHIVERVYAEAHNGLCRRCDSNFSFLIGLESIAGEDALIQYWYAMILTHISSDDKKEADCLIGHLTDFYQRKLGLVPSKERYINKMLYMLNSLSQPFDLNSLK
jgi:hypothetical protein